MTTPTTIKMRAYCLNYINAKLAQLNKRAGKLGLDTVSVTVTREWSVKMRDEHTGHMWDEAWIEVQPVGSVPVVEGYAIQARIEHTAAGNIVSCAPGVDEVPAMRAADGSCDHCGKRRNRIETYYVVGPDGAKLVGRSCLADFVRSADAARAVQFFANFALALRTVAEGDEDSMRSWGGSHMVDVLQTLIWAACVNREEGISKGRDLVDRADHLRFPGGCSGQGCGGHYQPEPRDIDRARGALSWILGTVNPSGYIANARIACSAGFIRPKNSALVASLIPSWDRELGHVAAQAACAAAPKPETHHVGEVGKRQEFGTVTITGRTFTEGNYGTTTILRMVDASGNTLVWFASGSRDLEIGKTYSLKATVKRHGDYKGLKQTVINRAILTEQV